MEQDLEIYTEGKYKNIYLKDKPKYGKKGIQSGNHIIVKKTFPEGRPWTGQYGTSYSCGVEYKGEKVSFWLSEREHEQFKALPMGANIRIGLVEEQRVNSKTGMKFLLPVLSFNVEDD